MIRRSSIGRRLGWLLAAVCFLPMALRAEAQAPSTAGSPEPAIGQAADQVVPGVQQLTAIEATPGDNEVRVFLETGGGVTAHPFVLDSPDRLVVDLPGVRSAMAKNRIEVDSPLVSRVRVGERGQDAAPVTRVVLDLKGSRAYDVKTEPKGVLVTVAGPAAVGAAANRSNAAPTGAGAMESADGAGQEVRQDDPIGEAANGHGDAAMAGENVPSAAPTAPSRLAAASRASAPETDYAADSPRTAAHEAPAAGPTAPAGPTDGVQQDPVKIAAATMPGMSAQGMSGGSMERSDTEKSVRAPEVGVTFTPSIITGEKQQFTGKKISLNLVDADIKQVFRLFHEISGLNFVLDPSVSGTVTIVLDEVPWDQALDLILKNNGLDKIYEANVIRIATTQKLASEASGRKALKDAKELEVDMIGITRRLSYAKAKDLDQIIKTGSLLSSRGKSYYDERTNTLIVADVPTRVAPLDKMITDLDSKTPQVMIEARIVLTGKDFLQELGVRWGFDYTQSATSWNFPHSGDVTFGVNIPEGGLNPNPLLFNLTNASGTFNLQLALDALETEGKSRVLSAPKVATQNNVKASIEQGIQIPIPNNNAVSSSVQFVNATLKLEVTPQITAEDTVIMDILVQNDRPNYTLPSVNQIPPIDTQKATTRVMVTDGGTTVIGGIFQVAESNSESGIPGLRKIPFFGWLFKTRTITTQNRELMIFITPKILRPS